MDTKTTIALAKILILIGLMQGLTACGGSKVLKEPQPIVSPQILATASDQRLSATLDWVIVRGGPGTWAKNVDWDEYLIRMQNLTDEPISITDIAVLDSLGTRIETRANRKQLVKGTKDTNRRYKGEGLKVKAGASAGTLLTASALAGATTVAVVSAAGLYSGTAAVAATGGLILIPALAVGGTFRGVNNGRVNKQIVSRQTPLPVVLTAQEELPLVFFFPLSPSPRQIEVTYVDSQGSHTLVVDTQAALDGLHLMKSGDLL